MAPRSDSRCEANRVAEFIGGAGRRCAENLLHLPARRQLGRNRHSIGLSTGVNDDFFDRDQGRKAGHEPVTDGVRNYVVADRRAAFLIGLPPIVHQLFHPLPRPESGDSRMERRRGSIERDSHFVGLATQVSSEMNFADAPLGDAAENHQRLF